MIHDAEADALCFLSVYNFKCIYIERAQIRAKINLNDLIRMSIMFVLDHGN